MATQIRVSPEAHKTLSEESKASGVPVTKIVDRLLVRLKRPTKRNARIPQPTS